MNSNLRKGFTLIEILIVVAIIAILASVVLVGLGPTQQAGRDARRVSDIHEIQNGLELYYNKCGNYPGNGAAACNKIVPATWAGAATSLQAALTGANVGVNNIPNDPSGGTTYYFYGTNTAAGASGVAAYGEYIVGAALENSTGNAFNGYTKPGNYADMAAAADWTGAALPASACAAPDYCVTL